MTEGWFKLGSGSCQRERTKVMRQAKGFSRHNQVIDTYTTLAYIQNTLCLTVFLNSLCLLLTKRNTDAVSIEH